jgi:hypothetical protein
MLSLATALTVYFTFYRTQHKIHKQYQLDDPSLPPMKIKIMRMLPSVCYSLTVIPLKLGYEKLATYLNNNGKRIYISKTNIFVLFLFIENHRLQTGYENNLTSKLFVFFFVNCFVGLFNEAFFNVNYTNVGQVNIRFSFS